MANITGELRVNRRFVLAAGAGFMAASSAGAQNLSQNGLRPTPGPGEKIATFVATFDLATASTELIERSRIAFIDTIGVMIGGAHEEVARIAREMVAQEMSAAHATVAGSSLRASPQLAALANAISAHAMDFDLTFASGQSVSPVIPALLALAESTGATPVQCG